MPQSAYPFLPARWLTRFDYATENYVREVDAPVLVIHGTADEIIAYAHGRAVYEAAREPKRMLDLQGGHNRGLLQSSERYLSGRVPARGGGTVAGTLDDAASLPREAGMKASRAT